MDVALDVCRGHTLVQRGALIQQSLTTGTQACPARADAQAPQNNPPRSPKPAIFRRGPRQNENGLMAVTRWRTIQVFFSTKSSSQPSLLLNQVFFSTKSPSQPCL